MAEYYAVERSPEYLAHYGVRGMRWGVIRKKIAKASERHKLKALDKKINDFSEGYHGSWDTKHKFDHNGYLNVNAVSKDSARGRLAWKALNEYDKRLGPNGIHGSPKALKIWKDVNIKYKKDYLKAVLKDAKIPVNKQTMARAHEIISAKDSEYSRYGNKRK